MNSQYHRNPPEQPEPRDTPSLISDAVQHGTRLVQNEIELAKREIARKASRAGGGIVMMLAALFLVFSALDVLAAAAVAGLAEWGLPVSVASLVVAGAALAIAALLFLVGKARLDPSQFTLQKTARNLRKDINSIKEKVHV